MPYELKGNCVVKADTGETVKCHDSAEEAKAHLAALEINVEKGANMEGFSYFIPLEKVVEQDDGSCLVYGTGVQEEPDVSNEIFDYDSSVPLLQKWSEATFKRSQGKSYGNVRAMHGKQAAGKLNEAPVYDGVQKRVQLCAKVIDPVDVQKCRQGVYTGFSIGGRYQRRWPDPKLPGAMRYTAEPLEFSLVDMPNVRNATFDLVKVGGDVELRKFAEDAGDSPVPVNEEVAAISGYGPDADSLKNESGWEYQVKAGVDTPDKAPNAMAHGVTPQHPEVYPVPEWVKPLVTGFEKIAEENNKKEQLLKVAGERSGIPRRNDGPLEPPLGYPVDSSDYGDPANWAWRYDTGEFAKASVAQYNLRKNRDRYSDYEWSLLGRRISYRVSALVGTEYAYDAVNKRIKQPEIKMPELQKGAFEETMAKVRKAAEYGVLNAQNPEAVLNALHQIMAASEINADVGGVPAPGTSVGQPLAMAASPDSAPPPASTVAKEAASTSTVAKEAPPASTTVAKEAPPASTATAPTVAKEAPPASSAPPPTVAKEAAATTPVEKGEDETAMEKLAKEVTALATIVKSMVLLNKSAVNDRPHLLQKSIPYGDLNSLPSGDAKPEMTPLQKAILMAAAEVSEGVTDGSIKNVLEKVAGNAEAAKGEAMKMVQQSLAERGFTSKAKLQTLSPAMISRIAKEVKNG